MNLEIQTSFRCQSHHFSQNKPHTFDEKWIDKRVYYLCMSISWMLVQNNMILHEEVRNIVIQIDSF